MHNRRGIDRCSTAQRWLEPDLVRGRDGGLVQAVAQPADHAIHMQGPVRRKTYFEKHFAFELQIACVVGVDRIGLERDFYWSAGWSGVRLRDLRSAVHDLLRSEAAGRNAAIAANVSLAAGCNAATEIRAGDRPLNPVCPTRSIPVAGTGGQVERSGRGAVQLCTLSTCAGQAIRIAKASGLHFLHRSVDCRLLRTAAEVSRVHQLRTYGVRYLQLWGRELVDHHFGRFHRLRSLPAKFAGHEELGLFKYWKLRS